MTDLSSEVRRKLTDRFEAAGLTAVVLAVESGVQHPALFGFDGASAARAFAREWVADTLRRERRRRKINEALAWAGFVAAGIAAVYSVLDYYS